MKYAVAVIRFLPVLALALGAYVLFQAAGLMDADVRVLPEAGAISTAEHAAVYLAAIGSGACAAGALILAYRRIEAMRRRTEVEA